MEFLNYSSNAKFLINLQNIVSNTMEMGCESQSFKNIKPSVKVRTKKPSLPGRLREYQRKEFIAYKHTV